MNKCVLSHDCILEEGRQNTVTEFFKLITLGKFNALASRTTDEWIDKVRLVKLRANVCWCKTDRQHADGQMDTKIWFFCLSHDNVLEKKSSKYCNWVFKLVTLHVNVQRTDWRTYCCKITHKRMLTQNGQTTCGRTDGQTNMIFFVYHTTMF